MTAVWNDGAGVGKNHAPTWQQLLDEGAELLKRAGVPDPELDAWYLLSEAFHLDRVHFFMDKNRPVFSGKLENGFPVYSTFLEKRAERIPLQHILGEQEFMGLRFQVNEHVLIPRQDTETLVEAVLTEHPERELSVLDMCTGSGCIAISLAVLGGYEAVAAADLSREALRVAKKNADRLFLVQSGTVKAKSEKISENPWKLRLTSRVYEGERLRGKMKTDSMNSTKAAETVESPRGMLRESRLTLFESDLFSQIGPEERYDIIVSNPPYIPSEVIESLEPEVKEHEPRMALDGDRDGLRFYRLLTVHCREHLKDGGSVYFEIGCDQGAAVGRFLELSGFKEIRIVKDAPGLDRVVSAVWKR